MKSERKLLESESVIKNENQTDRFILYNTIFCLFFVNLNTCDIEIIRKIINLKNKKSFLSCVY